MKKHYLTWGRSSVDDKQILSDIKRISRGNLEVPDNIELISTNEITPRNTNLTATNSKGGKNQKRKRKSYKSKKKY